MEAFVVIWMLCVVVGYLIGSPKGQGAAGAMLGALLGVIGLVIIAMMKPIPKPSGGPQPPVK